MRLRYTKQDGTRMEFHLGEHPITIGRSADADIVLADEKVSRIHCGIRLWDGDFYLKDLKSKNGTWVNGQKVEVSKLKSGDMIRIGGTLFSLEQDPAVGQETALQEIEGEMDLGKGYTTILREIVDDVGSAKPPAIPNDGNPAVTGIIASEAAAAPPTPPKRKQVKITVKRRG